MGIKIVPAPLRECVCTFVLVCVPVPRPVCSVTSLLLCGPHAESPQSSRWLCRSPVGALPSRSSRAALTPQRPCFCCHCKAPRGTHRLPEESSPLTAPRCPWLPGKGKERMIHSREGKEPGSENRRVTFLF